MRFTQKDFRQAMLKGQGRAILAVQAKPERYRKQVLQACKYLPSFDAQSEGTKARFLYDAVSCYKDKKPFIDAVLATLASQTTHTDKLDFALETVRLFADFDASLNDVLWQKYIELRERARSFKRSCASRDLALGAWEKAAMTLLEKKSVATIAEDAARFCLDGIAEQDEFFQLAFFVSRYFGDELKAAAANSPLAAHFADVMCASDKGEKRLPLRKRRAIAAESYPSATDSLERAKFLLKMSKKDVRAHLDSVINDALHGDRQLSIFAWAVLSRIRSPKVREAAKQRLDDTYALGAFAYNCTKKDLPLLMKKITSFPTDFFGETAWHSVFFGVMCAPEVPVEVARYVYETSYCANCRYRAVLSLNKSGELDDATACECRYDSLKETRVFARKIVNNRAWARIMADDLA